MKDILERISWHTRKLNLELSVFEVYLNDRFSDWGFSFLTVKKNYNSYSLFRFVCRLPNKTTVRNFTVDEIDFLFLRIYFHRLYDKLHFKSTVSRNLSHWESFLFYILNKSIK